MIFIGVWTWNVTQLPIPNGNTPYLRIFHELLMVMGTKYPSG
nr:hypothetical protein [Capnocytophaga canimorsus]